MRYFQLVIFLFFVNTVMASPYLEKGDDLFDPVFIMNKTGIDDELAKLADKGDADALYWFATSLERKNILKHAEAYKFYKLAAEKGHPYAMLGISGKVGEPGYDCELIGWPCDSDWKEKAIEKLSLLKSQGDIKAHYYHNKYTASMFSLVNPFGDFMDEEEMAIYAAKNNYYTPLIEFIGKQESISNEVLLVLDGAAKKNFGPALYFRGRVFNDDLPYEDRIDLLKKSALRGFYPAYNSLSYMVIQNGDYKLSYTYLFLEYLVVGEKSLSLGENDYFNYEYSSLSEMEIAQAKEEAIKIHGEIQREIYFDEGDFFSSAGMTKYRYFVKR